MNLLTRRQLISSSMLSLVASITGCGTLLYPERVGQRRGNLDNIDWTVVGMDAIGLVFFFVPGIIAFAIDFSNGSLFYPAGQYGNMPPTELQIKTLPDGEPSLTMIEDAVSMELGKPVKLRKGEFVHRPLESINEFWATLSEVDVNV